MNYKKKFFLGLFFILAGFAIISSTRLADGIAVIFLIIGLGILAQSREELVRECEEKDGLIEYESWFK